MPDTFKITDSESLRKKLLVKLSDITKVEFTFTMRLAEMIKLSPQKKMVSYTLNSYVGYHNRFWIGQIIRYVYTYIWDNVHTLWAVRNYWIMKINGDISTYLLVCNEWESVEAEKFSQIFELNEQVFENIIFHWQFI